jgi:hypothetical protein
MFIGITSPDQGRSTLIAALLNIQATYKKTLYQQRYAKREQSPTQTSRTPYY